MIVLDASVCAPWFLADESSEISDRLVSAFISEGGVVPSLWHIEMRNLFVVAHRRRRIDRSALDELMIKLETMRIETEPQSDLSQAVGLALAHGLSVYDACYLELALRHGLTLATLDRRLASAARAEGVQLFA